MKRLVFFAVIAIAAMWLLQYCSTADMATQREAIEPPFTNFNIPTDVNLVDAEEGATLRFASGTTVVIPPSCFVDADGNPVAGEVEVSYREIHNAAEIIVSGITMQYDSAGVKGTFVTAGMFDINAHNENGSVYIAEDKAIDVNMGSYNAGEEFNFYRLNTESSNWEYKGRPKNSRNVYKDEKLALLENPEIVKPIKPDAYNPEEYTFDLNINYTRFPELKMFNVLMWQYAGNNKKQDPKENKWIDSQNWTNIQLSSNKEQAGFYDLFLSNSRKSFKTIVKPVLRGRALRKVNAQFAAQLEKYNDYLESKDFVEAKLATQQADLIRSFKVRNMGVHNYDYLLHQSNTQAVFANINFNSTEAEEFFSHKVKLYQITANDKAVIEYYPSGDGKYKIYFSPDKQSKLVAVLPNEKVAVMSNKNFHKEIIDGANPTLNMTVLKQSFNNIEDFGKVVASLN